MQTTDYYIWCGYKVRWYEMVQDGMIRLFCVDAVIVERNVRR
jgi:hypothetical protein